MTRLCSLTLVLGLFACSGDDDKDKTGTEDTSDTGTDTTTDTETVPGELSVVTGDIPGVMIATLTTETSTTVTLNYGPAGESLDLVHPQTSTGTEHEFVVLGVKTSNEYDFQATVDGVAGSVVTKRVGPADPSVPTFNQQRWDPGLSCQDGGFIMLSYIGADNSGAVIIDRDGDVVWSVPFPSTNVQLSRVRPGLDGVSVTYTTADGNRNDQIGEIVRQPIDGSEPLVLSTPTAHHDYVELPDGSFAWLGYADFAEYTNCAKGTSLPKGTLVALDTINETAPDGTSVTVYDMFSDYPNPLDCSVDDEGFLVAQGVFDLSHSNSLAYRASDDAYFHMSRWQDAFWKIDRATGTFQWQFGGAYNDFTPVAGQSADELFNHSHMSEIWDGQVMIFNNNDFGPDAPGPSIVQEYSLDETAMTWEVDWAWESDFGFERLLGDARRMPVEGCDNVLVSLSQSAVVREITRDGEFAWAINQPLGAITSRVHFIPDIYDLTTALQD